jgi:MoxR-like ATPase
MQLSDRIAAARAITSAPTVPPAPAAGFRISPQHRAALRASLAEGIPTLLAGPAGSGKTELAAAIAHELNRPLAIIDCGAVRDPLDWYGSIHLADGRTQWVDTPLVAALATTNAIILLDEVNRAATIAQNTLLPLLDSRGRCELPQRAAITVAANVAFVATANEGMEYAATSAIDLALRSRFAARIECTYLSERDEADMLATRYGIAPDLAQQIARVAAATRKPTWIQQHGQAISTRAACAVARMARALAAQGADILPAWQCAALAQFDDTLGTGQTPRAALAALLASHGIG